MYYNCYSLSALASRFSQNNNCYVCLLCTPSSQIKMVHFQFLSCRPPSIFLHLKPVQNDISLNGFNFHWEFGNKGYIIHTLRNGNFKFVSDKQHSRLSMVAAIQNPNYTTKGFLKKVGNSGHQSHVKLSNVRWSYRRLYKRSLHKCETRKSTEINRAAKEQ